MTNPSNISEASKALFVALAEDAGNWNGQPLVNISKEARGNLTQLKRAGLITTEVDDGCLWAQFTTAGIEFALTLGHDIAEYCSWYRK